MCQKEDLSADFTLLFFSSAALLLLVGFSVVLLYRVGSGELPSQLASVGPGPLKKD